MCVRARARACVCVRYRPSGDPSLRILREALRGPSKAVRIADAVAEPTTVGLGADARPLAREAGYVAVQRLVREVHEVHHGVVGVHSLIVKRVVGLDANDRLDVPVHAGRRRQVVDWIILAVPHDHPCDYIPGNELLLEPPGVRCAGREAEQL